MVVLAELDSQRARAGVLRENFGRAERRVLTAAPRSEAMVREVMLGGVERVVDLVVSPPSPKLVLALVAWHRWLREEAQGWSSRIASTTTQQHHNNGLLPSPPKGQSASFMSQACACANKK